MRRAKESRLLRACAVAAIVAPLMLASGPALSAPTGDPAAAQVLFEKGQRAFADGQIDAACKLFEESLRLDYAVGTLFNLSRCEDSQGKLASAWLHLREGMRRLPTNDPRYTSAVEKAADLEARVPMLDVRLAEGSPPEARITRDGVALTSVSLGIKLPVDPGPHEIVVEAPGYTTNRTTLTLAVRESKSIVVSVGPALPKAPEDRVVAVEPAPALGPRQPLRTIGWVVGGIGVGALATGVVTGAITAGRAGVVHDHCDGTGACDDRGLAALDDAHRYGTISTVTVAGGLTLVAAAVVLFVASR